MISSSYVYRPSLDLIWPTHYSIFQCSMAERPNCPHYTGTPGYTSLSARESVFQMCCHYPCPVLQISSLHPFTHSYPIPRSSRSEIKVTHPLPHKICLPLHCPRLGYRPLWWEFIKPHGYKDILCLWSIITGGEICPQLYGKGYVSLHEPVPVGRPINECFHLFPEHWVLAREHYNLWPQQAHGCPAQNISGKAHKAAR